MAGLAGVSRVPIGAQPKNMARRYVENPLIIILCVIAANSDIVTSDGLILLKISMYQVLEFWDFSPNWILMSER